MSGLRCWIGAAVVLTKPDWPENWGATGTIIARGTHPHCDWLVCFSRPLRRVSYRGRSMVEVEVQDWKLTPITPPPSADTTDDRAPCEVEPAQPDRVSA